MKAKTRHWFIYQQPCFRFHIFAIHLIGVRIMPLAGRDVKAIVILRRTEDISIHAPLAGRDLAECGRGKEGAYFNPRAPCGARPRRHRGQPHGGHAISIHAPLAGRDAPAAHDLAAAHQFQSTRPLRGATMVSLSIFQLTFQFQSTRPLRGATWHTFGLLSFHPTFQSTRPLRGATYYKYSYTHCGHISIHAPLAGRDDRFPNAEELTNISIHAPLAGRD